MLTNRIYDNIKVMYDMSRLLWFIREHAIKEAAKQENEEILNYYKKIEHDLEKHIETIKKMIFQ